MCQTKHEQIIIYFLLRLIHIQRQMFEPFKFLYKTIAQEITDQFTIIKEIAQYYNDEIYDSNRTKKQIQEINTRLKKAKTYNEWKRIAGEYDQLPSIQQKIHQVYSPFYDYKYIQQLLKCLSQARENGEIQKLINILRSHSYRNIGNINCPLLYRDAFNSTKKLIQDFQDEIAKCFRAILNGDIQSTKKLEFFGQMRHAVGRSALLLSGGAILGMYHIGVVQTLIEADCMPKIIAGSSAGSIIASILATRNREEFFDGRMFNFTAFANKKKHSLWRKLKRAGKEGYLMDIKVLQQFLQDNIGQYTFQEAYDKFGVILNITVTGSSQHDEDRLLNYLTAPNVLIWSASAASCAIPFIYGATDLYCKDHQGNKAKYTLMNRKFLDGSIAHDLPMNKLSIFFNVNNFIVSQTNPWVIPFMDYTQDFRTITNPVLVRFLIICHQVKEFILSEVKHRASQLVFVFPSAITKFFNLFTQAYVGNITIWPVPSVADYLRIMQNPTDFEMIKNFVEDGKARAFPKITHIKSSLFMEKQIDSCYKNLRRASKMFFLASQKDVEDADQEQYLLKNSFVKVKKQEDRESQKDFDIIEQKVENQLNLKKKVQIVDVPKTPRNIPSKKYRNESFLIPRQHSFGD